MPYQRTGTVRFFRTICKIIYLSCSANFWFEDMDYPPNLMKIYKNISKVLEILAVLFIIFLWGPVYTQHNLNEKQTNDMYLYAFSHFVVYCIYFSALYYRLEIKELVLTLAVKLKEVCNDEMTEKMMVRSAVLYLTGFTFLICFTLLSNGVLIGMQAFTSNVTFTTVITMWPDVEDRSLLAGIARILFYIMWWVFVVRTMSPYLIMLSNIICLAHQFTNLRKYFEDLSEIFEGVGSQEDKEKTYEDAFKVGIKMHALTLWCAKQLQRTGGVAFSAQVIINVSVMVLLMMQMMFTERTLTAILPKVFMAASVMVSSGVFMWNAGDVTVEASRLPTAMFHSGWHNCQRQSSVRVRKMVTIAITQAQKPVLMQGLGFIELSYESYVTIVKSSYSVFSVIY